MDPFLEIAGLESLWERDPAAFYALERNSKWGRQIARQVIHPLKRNEPRAVEDAVIFLEANARYFRSGYAKARIASILKSKTLTDDQRARLCEVLLAAPESEKIGPEFKEYVRLAVVVADGRFLRKLEGLADSAEGRVQARYTRMLNFCLRHGNQSRTSR